MKKIRITEKQAELLRSLALSENTNKKVVKITREQYDRLFKGGIIKETLSPLERSFKTEFAKHDVKNLGSVSEIDYQQNSKFNIMKPNPSLPKSIKENDGDLKKEITELVKYMYRKSENFSPFWEQHDLTFDDICDVLKSKNMIISKNGKFELSKSLGSPQQAMQSLEDELRNLVGDLKTENYPLGAKDDPNAPYNQNISFTSPIKPKSEPFEVIYYNQEIAILKGPDGYYAFFYFNIDKEDLAQYAEREKIYVGKADGEPDFDYGDFNIDADIIQNYVNDNLKGISKGEGFNDWERGVDLVKIDSELKQDLISTYDKDKKITAILSSIQENETDFDSHLSKIKTSLSTPDISKAPEGETDEEKLARLKSVIAKKREDSQRISKEKGLGETTTAASSGQFTAPMGMTSGKMPVDNDELDVPVVYETTTQTAGDYTYDANALPGINRDGSFKKTGKTKAEKNTQWAGGAFVDFDDCTKLNNKSAGSGCSQGAVDNVVKLKKTSGNINAPSLSDGKQ